MDPEIDQPVRPLRTARGAVLKSEFQLIVVPKRLKSLKILRGQIHMIFVIVDFLVKSTALAQWWGKTLDGLRLTPDQVKNKTLFY